jgi:short-subunit dehydrogenase
MLGWLSVGAGVVSTAILARILRADADLSTYSAKLPGDAFRGKVVWITGASSGIGEALAKGFAAQGSKLVLSSRREEVLNRLKENLSCESVVVPLDLEDFESLPGKAVQAKEAFGRIDIVVNCGGISTRCLARDTGFDVDQRIMRVDYLGHICLTKAVLPWFIEQNSGHFVNVSSAAGLFGVPQRTAYCAAKAALNRFFEALRYEERCHNITVTTVCPGFVRTQVSYNALGPDGKPTQQTDTDIAGGMTAERCARLIMGAVHEKLPEAWISSAPPMIMMYLNWFAPPLFRLMMNRMVQKQLNDAHNAKARRKQQ